jgi:hypothetical protein
MTNEQYIRLRLLDREKLAGIITEDQYIQKLQEYQEADKLAIQAENIVDQINNDENISDE